MQPSPAEIPTNKARPTAGQADGTAHPKRVLGFRDLVMFYVVTTLSLRWIPVAASVGPSSIVIWIVGLLTIFVPLALCVMELSSRYPQEGGLYLWTKRAFGDFPAFLTGWIYWTSNLPYFPAVLYFAASNALYVGGTRWNAWQVSPAYFIGFSFFGVGLALGLNVVGLNIGKWLNNIGSQGTWIPVAILCAVAVAAWMKFGSATSFNAANMKPGLSLGMLGVWATLLYAFSGAESASFMGDEIKDARRTVPRALITAGVIITAGYTLGTVAVLVALPQAQVNSMEGIMQAITSAAARVGWNGLGPAVALLICLANLGGVGAYLAALARIPFVAGIDRYLPPAFGRVHPKWGTPAVALVTQAVCCMVFILLGQAGSTVHGAYQVLVTMTIITNFVPYLFMFAAMIRLQREPVEAGVIRVPGGKPVATALALVGVVTTLAVIVASVVPDPSEPNKVLAVAKVVFFSVLLIGGGMLLYAVGRTRSRLG
ncbi:MAG TPA: APC family permease [Terriglobales bacterium]